MSTKIVYFSRSGTSKMVAVKIAGRLGAELLEVKDQMNWRGIIGFIRGGYYASTNKSVEFTLDGTINEGDKLIIVSPIWAGDIAPTMKSFLKNLNKEEIDLVVTASGSDFLKGAGFKSVTMISKNKKNEDQVLEAFFQDLAQRNS